MYPLILALISTHKVELIEVNGYGSISDNDEAADTFYIFRFTSFPYTLQQVVESDGNQLVYGDPVCNAIYKSIVRHKSRFISSHIKNCACVNEQSCYSRS